MPMTVIMMVIMVTGTTHVELTSVRHANAHIVTVGAHGAGSVAWTAAASDLVFKSIEHYTVGPAQRCFAVR